MMCARQRVDSDWRRPRDDWTQASQTVGFIASLWLLHVCRLDGLGSDKRLTQHGDKSHMITRDMYQDESK